jgi:hypothetical protein
MHQNLHVDILSWDKFRSNDTHMILIHSEAGFLSNEKFIDCSRAAAQP